MRRQVVGLLGIALISGCAGMSAPQVGHTIGTIAGSVLAPGIGAPIGAVVGLVTGMLIQGQVDKVVEKQERHSLNEQLGAGRLGAAVPTAPPAGDPIRVWVDETLQEGRLIAGHFDVRRLP